MRAAFRTFAPYRDVPKVTMFGSARTHPDDPLYEQARSMAKVLADHGWMVVTGAGPGIMAAGMEGAGRDMSFGVTIRLPFENEPNPVIAGDPKLVSMKYFFTRKLMLIKESRAFLCLPGGFGTLDEAFELLTLVQTGKSTPAPIVMLDVPNGTYWTHWREFVVDELAGRQLIADSDVELFLVTDDVEAACDEIVGFYSNYDSMRYVGDRLVIRLARPPDAKTIEMLERDFADIALVGRVRRDRSAAGGDRGRRPARQGAHRVPIQPQPLRQTPRAHRRAQSSPLKSTSSGSRRIEIAFSTLRRARVSRRSSTGSSVPPASMDSRRRTIARSASSSAIASSRARMSSNSPAIGCASSTSSIG